MGRLRSDGQSKSRRSGSCQGPFPIGSRLRSAMRREPTNRPDTESSHAVLVTEIPINQGYHSFRCRSTSPGLKSRWHYEPWMAQTLIATPRSGFAGYVTSPVEHCSLQGMRLACLCGASSDAQFIPDRVYAILYRGIHHNRPPPFAAGLTWPLVGRVEADLATQTGDR